MAVVIYNDSWSPSNINCEWKPKKLSRYSFLTNLIDFNSEGILIGYSQNSANPQTNSSTNLTDYISVQSNHNYFFKCEKDINRGIRYIAFFDSEKNYLSNISFPSGASTSLKGNFETPSDCAFIRITLYKASWEKCSLRDDYYNPLTNDKKEQIPLNIVDNEKDVSIYKDLHFEVYVKAEAFIKNFIDCFDLSVFQNYPSNSLFSVYNSSYYKNLNYENYVGGSVYRVGDYVKGIFSDSSVEITYYLVCRTTHISQSNFNDEVLSVNFDSYWLRLDEYENSWLKIQKNINEDNYNPNINFPYVAYLLFKNIWGCDRSNYLNTFVNKTRLTLLYNSFFAKNLRQSISSFDKFFDQGYFDDANNYNSVNGFGLRLIRGENFRNDDILGDLIANNYLSFVENKHSIPENWNYSEDVVNNNYFGGTLFNPFDHYYLFEPKQGIPFFKEKNFEDFQVEINLQRNDSIGNIFKRIINLPIFVKFYNNLIKVYFTNTPSNYTSHFYDDEYLNSNQEHNYYVKASAGTNLTYCIDVFTIWCPNIERLSISSTIIGSRNINERPVFTYKNGQLGVIRWQFNFNALNIGEVMRAVHILEYSDGENYDKFIYIENITITN